MPEREIYAWEGQDGGIEGPNQDTWAYVYIEQIRYIMRTQPYPFFIFCKRSVNCTSIFLNVDASAWNNSFRGEAIHPLCAQTQDTFFDTSSKTHEIYQYTFLSFNRILK